MASSPAFAATPRIGATTISTANANRDGTGTIATIITAAATGTQIREINFKATGTTVASQLNIYLYDGTTYSVLDEVSVSATTASTTVASYESSVRYDNLFLPSGWSVRASITLAPTSGVVVAVALGADL